MTSLHPDDELLLAHAAGSLDSGAAVVVGAHLEHCARCRGQVTAFERLGGAMLEAADAADLAPAALARTLARIDAPPPPARRARPAPARPPLPAGAAWPRSLRGCEVSRWYWIGPGMRWSRVRLPHDPAANVFLLRIGAGKCLPAHTHTGRELTQVLYGTFDDGRALFAPGDFDEADGSVHHQPVVQPGGECICLASVLGKVRFEGAVARVFGALIGM